ncbi:MAG: RNA pyrophosphohydrolase [Halofilum sp. (in: g-proteobacteria)]|nr:RNA pyrophosphohydrolase [Halofilum sp. (in: g-proteobacteria)]
MIDSKGYRANVGIILTNDEGCVFWARRTGQDAWQFPQGGMRPHETPLQAMYRELDEETGLQPKDVELIGRTRGWLRYRLPERYVRRRSRPVCIGQKQRWYILRLVGAEDSVDLNRSERPEFDDWRWVDYWLPPRDVIFFKRRVYRKALRELAPLVFPEYAGADDTVASHR